MSQLGQFNNVKSHLHEIDQEQILRFVDKLDNKKLLYLLAQTKNLDFSKIPAWVEKYVLHASCNPFSLKVTLLSCRRLSLLS